MADDDRRLRRHRRVSGKLLDPYSPGRLLAVSGGVCALALIVALLALWRLARGDAPAYTAPTAPKPAFRVALAEVWANRQARRFTIFVVVSMPAYGAQDLILEPFAGMVHGQTPGQSTQLSGVQHGGVRMGMLIGMLMAAFAGRRLAGSATGSRRGWTVGGCIASPGAADAAVFAIEGLLFLVAATLARKVAAPVAHPANPSAQRGRARAPARTSTHDLETA